ncbi:RNA chaperone Hfq [Fictibacillus enclensis]|uniref:RNA-binding protein Hfq n=4 Tax=Fictibacillus TaxID=1329200 RepID=A0A0V8JDX2_9BACL|nr:MULTISPECIES: RNA chaperone Hfq [Fictibacillus]KSU85149.1 RNA chaperone Hfq [Fictibacillus enclensis]MDM5198951.1 RNA chaperone Hfq [Fictibacillus enclensis]MDM5338155.1 RNA chaperone Hfq [Fictibacillus enclensis]MDN4073354.1 RNA chaperone Hfq [Fictibacillus sp. CENA-BCM004]MDN4523369.1 RNA chaperone Hfq [Fictibacillus sp. NE201]
MKQAINIQDQYLNQLRRENIYVTVYLLNGFQLKGLVKGFDNFTVILESEGKQHLIYKHAISTFTPHRPVELPAEN